MVDDKVFVAEVVSRTPWGFKSTTPDLDLLQLAVKHGDIVGIHVDAASNGSFSWLQDSCQWAKKPVVAFGVDSTPQAVERALCCGALKVVVVGDILMPASLEPHVWYEPLSRGFAYNVRLEGRSMVWNNKDPLTNQDKPQTFWDLSSQGKGFVAQTADITTRVREEADAFIISTDLPEFCKSLDKLRNQ